MNQELLDRIGIPSHLPAAEQAAALSRLLPLRVRSRTSSRDPATIVEAGWCDGVNECLRVLGEVYRGEVHRASAYGGAWAYLTAGGRLVAPGLPVVVAGVSEIEGPDGVYQLRRGVVWREACGVVAPGLTLVEVEPDTAPTVDLVWFGDCERYLVHDRTLEIEDLFSTLYVAATSRAMDRLLVRGLNADRDVLEELELSDRQFPARLEVRRLRELLVGEAWLDPATMLAERVDISRVDRQGDQLIADSVRGARVVFNLVEEQGGWSLFLWEGRYPLRSLGVRERDGVVTVSATVDPELDILGRGLRSRLAFDVRSDLISVGSGG